MADQLSAFSSATGRNADQQRALLAALAESGSAGAAAYKQAQVDQSNIQQAALKVATQAPSAQLGDTNALNAAALNGSQQSFEQDIARQQAANGNYMSQVGAAIPIVESRTRMGVEQIIAQQQRQREQDALQLQQSQLSLQGQRESIAAQREERAASAANGGITPYQSAQIKLAEADNKRADDAVTKSQADKDAQAVQDRRDGYLTSLAGRSVAAVDKNGNPSYTEAYKAIYSVATGQMSLEQALATFKTPGGKPLNRDYLQRELDNYTGIK